MKKVPYRNQLSKFTATALVALLLFSVSIFAQEDAKKGKQIFNQNCAACHSLDRKMTGPALRNVEARLEEEGLDREWIYAWVKNSPALIKSGDAYANKIYNEYKKAAMTPFPTLSNTDIDNILAYTAEVVVDEKPKGPKNPNPVPVDDGISSEIILGALVFVFTFNVVFGYEDLKEYCCC